MSLMSRYGHFEEFLHMLDVNVLLTAIDQILDDYVVQMFANIEEL